MQLRQFRHYLSPRYALTRLLCAWLALQVGFFYGASMRKSGCIFDQNKNSPRHLLKEASTNKQAPSSVLGRINVWGVSTVDVEAFVRTFRLGVPWHGYKEEASKGSSRMLLLYQNQASVPDRSPGRAVVRSTKVSIPHQPLRGATANCREVKQVVTHFYKREHRNSRVCLAIVGHRESFHTQKWIHEGEKWNFTGRYDFINYNTVLQDLTTKKRKDAFEELGTYLTAVEDAVKRLRPIAAKVAQAGKGKTKGTIIVLTSNYGHSELFVNYVCAARAAGMDLSKFLLFATDQETYDLAQSLGIAAFYDKQLFAEIPKDAATGYGSKIYAKIMMSKAYSVHLASQLGYDFLFQDVDIVPYKNNYLEWWIDKAKSGFDLYFQTDLSGRPDYAPWNANSGCYFAVNNNRTQYFFASMVLQGDMILKARSHQAPMHAILNELGNQFGLRIQTIRKDNLLIPIGSHFHRNPRMFIDPLFKNRTMSMHYNWNNNAEEKRQFLDQMGDWHVTDQCLNLSSSSPKRGLRVCCADKPKVICHYRDIPSVVSCANSPPMNKGGNSKSLW